MASITAFYFFVFAVECLGGEVPEMREATVSANHKRQINGGTGTTSAAATDLQTTAATNELNEWERNCTLTKHESFCNCSNFVLLLPGDYTLTNGTAHINALNMTYNESFYESRDGHLVICFPESEINRTEDWQKERNSGPALHYITAIGLTVSLLGLFVHLVSFVAVPNMKNMPGTCLASLCASMLIGYLSFLIGGIDGFSDVRMACIASAAISHFFILSSLLWMNVKAFNIYKALYHSTSIPRRPSRSFSWKKFSEFSAYAWGTSFLFTSAALICDNVDGVPMEFRPLFAEDSCWFGQLPATWIFFIGPAFVIIGINAIFFGLSVHAICSNRNLTEDSQTRTYFVTYYKLVLVMGVLWLSGILARITDNTVLWYIFALSIALQGFFIFVAFTFPDLRKYASGKLQTATKELPHAVSNTTINTNVELEEISSRNASDG